MTNYGRKLEKEYRDGMVVGAIYNFIGKGTHGWKYKYRLVGFEGYGENLLLIFKAMDDTVFRIMAADMGGFSLISEPTEEKKDETTMGIFDEYDDMLKKKWSGRDEMFEKKWRETMIVGERYDIMRKGTNGWVYVNNLTFSRSYGHGLDFTLIFENYIHEKVDIKAFDIGWMGHHVSSSNVQLPEPIEEEKDNTDMKFLDEFDEIFDKKLRERINRAYSLLSPDKLPEPMQLVKKIEGYKFDEKAFYRATNGVRHFLIKDSDNDKYEALYYGPTLDRAGMHIAFARTVGFTDVSCESAKLYHDKIVCDPVETNFKLFRGDSVCTHEEIKIDDIFKREEKLEWDIDKLKVGKAYRIQDIDGNETDGIYRCLYEPTTSGQSSIVFTVVSDEKVTGTAHVYSADLASGKIKIYELTCGGESE